jgi:hypothetical protein
MTAKNIIEKLSNDIGWIHRITQQFEYSRDWPYDSTDFRLFPEVTVRIQQGKKLQRRRMDAVAVIRVNSHRYRPILAGIEVKVTASDLMNDKKVVEYLPYVDTFYLAVPAELVDVAIAYTRTDLRLRGVGVLKVGRCVEVIKQGSKYIVDLKKRGELTEELLMKSLWKEAEQG